MVMFSTWVRLEKVGNTFSIFEQNQKKQPRTLYSRQRAYEYKDSCLGALVGFSLLGNSVCFQECDIEGAQLQSHTDLGSKCIPAIYF